MQKSQGGKSRVAFAGQWGGQSGWSKGDGKGMGGTQEPSHGVLSTRKDSGFHSKCDGNLWELVTWSYLYFLRDYGDCCVENRVGQTWRQGGQVGGCCDR